MNINKIYNHLDAIYHFTNQAEWDASGLINHKEDINKILICLDINEDTIIYCVNNCIDLIISHHPLFVGDAEFENKLSTKSFSLLKQNNISAIFLHTPFDSSIYGMNHEFLNMLNLKNVRHGTNTSNYVVGEFKENITIDKLSNLIKQTFNLDFVKYNKKYKNKKIKTVGFCSGSGSSFIYELNDSIDVFITSDIKYHTWIDSDSLEIILIDINHNIENMFIDIVNKYLYPLTDELIVYTIESDLKFNII